MNQFLLHKRQCGLSYRAIGRETGLNREYIRKLLTYPGEHKNIKAMILIGEHIGMSETIVRTEWVRLRKIEVLRRIGI